MQNALDKAAAGRTMTTIAHRLSTIKEADCIYVMGDGLVLESGTHDEPVLRNENGAYVRLVSAQKLRETCEKATQLKGDDGRETAASHETLEESVEKQTEEEIPLGRSQSGTRSLTSEILEGCTQGQETDEAHTHSSTCSGAWE